MERILKELPDVEDAVVVGVPNEKWGQAVAALAELRGGMAFDEDALRRYVRGRLAAYKVPKHILNVDSVGRAANGTADYAAARTRALRQLRGAD